LGRQSRRKTHHSHVPENKIDETRPLFVESWLNMQYPMNRIVTQRNWNLGAWLSCSLFICLSHQVTAESISKPDFAGNIRPILAQNCFSCHGPDATKRTADLRLDTRQGAFSDLGGYRALVSGNLEKSVLYQRIITQDPDDQMPPPDSGKKLNPDQIQLIARWIESGAVWEEHWAFTPLNRPALPTVSNENWPANGIDYFVMGKLDEKGLNPSPPADKHSLIRRVSLDLTGLPPNQKEVKIFLNDQSPKAYAHLVNRLLNSPAYGERWAQVWLDLARYADTKGYEKDLRRSIWRYRDWVIDAFNDDMPFDQFTREQLAGDLLPDPTMDQLIATAFHRNTMTNDEGGTSNEEYRVAAVKDRVDLTGQVWMGLTVGCAQCHSHKFDPITHEEYYQLFAFFNQTEDTDRSDEAPKIKTPTRSQQKQIDQIASEIRVANKQIENTALNYSEGLSKWEWDWKERLPLTSDITLKFEKNQKLILGLPIELAKILTTPADKIEPAQVITIRDHYLKQHSPEGKRLLDELAVLETQQSDLLKTVPTTLVMRELPIEKERKNYVMLKGNYLEKGTTVEPAVLKSFHPMPANLPRNRLGLAQWLMDADNPLTARVTVNRFWARFFGKGIVETEEDFGTQGSSPSHPKLLNWLAEELLENEWSLKDLCRTIVLSNSYQQSSKVTPDRLDQDPFNRWLSRGARFRLSAEMVRDYALTVSGLLSRKMYGPSVMPPQPEGIWQTVYSTDSWKTSPGEDRYRRGLYTFIRRTSPYPSMLTFDAPSREVCTVRRIRTNTPLQALVTLNDPVYIEAAQALARRVLKKTKVSGETRLKFALESVLIRQASSREIDLLKGHLKRRLDFYHDHPEDALAMATDPIGELPATIGTAEAAAWTSVCNVILNLDEALTRN
jgi:mono/diheme cytochrome c family protein